MMTMSRIVLRLFLVLTLVFTVSGSSMGQGSPTLQLLAHVNDYASARYNDCWGYTAPGGREYAFLGVRNGTSILDITDAPAVREVAFIPGPTSTWKDIKTYRTYAYVVTESSGGMQILDLSQLPDTVTLASTYTGFQTSHNISIDTARAMLYAEGNGPGPGTEPVRALSLSDPVNPVQVSAFGVECHDIFARNGTVYVSEGNSHSIGIYDLSTPSAPSFIARFTIPTNGYVHNAWPTEDGRYLMTTEETFGRTVKLWDIDRIDSVQLTGQYLASAAMAHNTHIKGHYAYISHYAQGLRIVDISDPANIVEVGHYDTFSGSGLGAWGAFPFFSSGKVLVSDVETGLYVVNFPGGATSAGRMASIPGTYRLGNNYPNPFNPSTTITFEIPHAGQIRLTVLDLLGRKIRILLDEYRDAGRHQVRWDGRSDTGIPVVSGTYFCRLEAGGYVGSRKMLLLK
jgi:choice-of-anchor B domain-containing protein